MENLSWMGDLSGMRSYNSKTSEISYRIPKHINPYLNLFSNIMNVLFLSILL